MTALTAGSPSATCLLPLDPCLKLTAKFGQNIYVFSFRFAFHSTWLVVRVIHNRGHGHQGGDPGQHNGDDHQGSLIFVVGPGVGVAM